MESMGSNLLMIRSASAKSGGVRMGMGTKPTLTMKDAAAIEAKSRGILAIAPYSSEGKQITYGNQNWSTTVGGTTMPYFMIRNYEIESGRVFYPRTIKTALKLRLLVKPFQQNCLAMLTRLEKRSGSAMFRLKLWVY